MKKPGMPGQAHSTAMQRPAFASTEDEPIDGEELTESKGEIAVVAGIAGSFVAGAVLNKAVRVHYQKKLNAYADAHSSDGLVHFNKFTKEKMSRSEIETYSKRFADKLSFSFLILSSLNSISYFKERFSDFISKAECSKSLIAIFKSLTFLTVSVTLVTSLI